MSALLFHYKNVCVVMFEKVRVNNNFLNYVLKEQMDEEGERERKRHKERV